MKKVFLFMLFVLFGYVLCAQQIFQKSYYIDSNATSTGDAFVQLSNGGYLLAGSSSSSPNIGSNYILRVNSMGDVVWSKTYSSLWRNLTSDIDKVNDTNKIPPDGSFRPFAEPPSGDSGNPNTIPRKYFFKNTAIDFLEKK